MKKNIKITLILFSLFCMSFQLSFGQANNVRGMYVQDIDNWLGDASAEDAILTYAQGNAYTYITFYDLGSLNFSSSVTKNALASFIHRAKTQYGILEMGAAGENAAFFSNNIIPFNNGRSLATEKFDILNFEFEFWVSSSISGQYCSRYLTPNGFSCDTSGAYKFAKREMIAMEAIANANGLISEMYLGWPNRGQIQDVANTVDRILLHAYRPTDADVYQYSRNRLIDIAGTGHSVKIIPIFSGEAAFMGPWLNSHSLTQAYQTYSSYYTAETGSWKQNIDLQGYHWFTYEDMPKTVSAVATISAGGPTTFCTGGSVTLTANSGSAYLWSPGGQTTRSITATQSGSYSVRVTSATGTNVTSSPVTVTVGTTTTAPTITASGPTAFCSSSSVTLTSSTASSYLWSNGETTQSITVNQSGSYTVNITSGTCTAVSAPISVTASAAPAIPTITASGPLTMCSGSSVTLTSSSANGYLWSTGQTTPSITVSTSGTYWVRVFSSGNCFNQSGNVVVNAATAPSTPVINASGPLNICPGSSLTLSTAYSSGGYLWSTGATTQTITVQTADTYWVRVFNGSSCSAQSANTVVTLNTNNTPPVITPNGSLGLCSGSSVTLTSTPSSNYLWSNGETTQSITVSTAGTYWVRTGSGNCVAQSTDITVTTNGASVPLISASGSTDLCTGSSVTLTSSIAGGYLWSTGETTQSIVVSTGGSYWVRGYASGSCYAQSTNLLVTELTAPLTPTINASGSLALSSSNPSVTLSSSSANAYMWSNGATTQSIVVVNGGSYFVTVTGTNGCSATSSPTVVTSTGCVPPPIPVISLSGSSVLQPGQTVTLTASPGSGYLWSTGDTTQSIVVSSAGIYDVRVYDGTNCYSVSNPVAITEATTGLGNVNTSDMNGLTVYPNPGRNQVSVSFIAQSPEDAELVLFDMTGREMSRNQIRSSYGENKIELNVADYPRGIYYAYLLLNKERQNIKLILQ